MTYIHEKLYAFVYFQNISLRILSSNQQIHHCSNSGFHNFWAVREAKSLGNCGSYVNSLDEPTTT